MTVVFYILWILAIARVFLSPTFRVTKKGASVLAIGIGIWLLVGVSIYQTKHAEYELKRSLLQEEIDAMYAKKRKLEALLLTHPTSRDVLLSLGELAYRLHDQKTFQFALSQLEKVDPNHPKVLELRTMSKL